eukprot:503790-Prymnesium_polylepis.1
MVGRAPPPSLTCGGVVPLATARSTPEQTWEVRSEMCGADGRNKQGSSGEARGIIHHRKARDPHRASCANHTVKHTVASP